MVFSLKKRSSILTIQLLLEFGFDHPISKLRLGLDVFKVGIWNWYWLPSIPAVWKFLKLELETYINTERHWAYPRAMPNCSPPYSLQLTSLSSNLLHLSLSQSLFARHLTLQFRARRRCGLHWLGCGDTLELSPRQISRSLESLFLLLSYLQRTFSPPLEPAHLTLNWRRRSSIHHQ